MSNEMLRRGLVQVYTGNGKGKTTASLGLAMRATGHNHRVIIIQFMKGSSNYGELKAAERLSPQLTIRQFGLETFVSKDNPSAEDIKEAQRGLEAAREVIFGGNYDLVILDEINVALDYNLIPLDEVLQFIKDKPAALELVLTGRYAHEQIIEAADLVSEINLVKHPFYNGVDAREGIEF